MAHVIVGRPASQAGEKTSKDEWKGGETQRYITRKQVSRDDTETGGGHCCIRLHVYTAVSHGMPPLLL